MIASVGTEIWVVTTVVALGVAVVVAVVVVVTPSDTNTIAVAVEFAGPPATPLPLGTISICHSISHCNLSFKKTYSTYDCTLITSTGITITVSRITSNSKIHYRSLL
jgi:hypothetical protein